MNDIERPDGSVVTTIGWCLIVIGVIGAFVAASADTTNGLITGLALTNFGLGLGVILLSLGYLVRAIWFLPGREIETTNFGNRAGRIEGETCDWCGRSPASGKPCSAFSGEALSKISVKIANPVCQEQLRQRNYPVAADLNS